MTNKGIDCEEALRRIFELIDHQLDGRERDAMERHLAACKSCFSRADFERRLRKRLASLREAPSASAVRRVEDLLKGF